MSKRDFLLYVEDILEAIDAINEYKEIMKEGENEQ